MLEVLIGIVEDDEARPTGIREAVVQFVDQGVQLGLSLGRVLAIDVGVVGIKLGQRCGDGLEPGLGVHRVEPTVRVQALMGMAVAMVVMP